MTINQVDIVCGLAWGDEAKGKIVSSLIETNTYDWVCRWSGGSNAGHTIYIKGQRYVTHIVPAGILHGIPSFIGPDCYVHIESLIKELDYLKHAGFDTRKLYVSDKAHIITDKHIEEDSVYIKTQGSTGSGIAPCARDKYGRVGKLFKSVDTTLFNNHNKNIVMSTKELYGSLLCEGAQGTWLDINYGNYPYVTSSLTLPYSACSLCFPPSKIKNIYGASKIYDTRVGIDPSFIIQEDADILNKIAEEGSEFGSTTGRKRHVQWLNVDKLIDSIRITGCTYLFISKIDILIAINHYKLYYNKQLHNFMTINAMIHFINTTLFETCCDLKEIHYSDNPKTIKGSIIYKNNNI